jgi:hypothetical protein
MIAQGKRLAPAGAALALPSLTRDDGMGGTIRHVPTAKGRRDDANRLAGRSGGLRADIEVDAAAIHPEDAGGRNRRSR